MINAEILTDSINNDTEDRLTSWVLTYPHFIAPEMLRHRCCSRNVLSSRAIPPEKMLRLIKENPAMPIFWGSAKETMQAGEEISPEKIERAKGIWSVSLINATQCAIALSDLGLHKQHVNRLIEPYAHTIEIMSSTEYENFFSLRAHPDAQPEIKKLAEVMLELYNGNKPTLLKPGDWHVPFADKYAEHLSIDDKLKVSVARCARASYKSFDGSVNHEKDFKLHDRLKESGHMSPFEQQARAMSKKEANELYYLRFNGQKIPGVCGNFKGFIQYRKHCAGENRLDSRVKKWSIENDYS